jgi:hypothetical protein
MKLYQTIAIFDVVVAAQNETDARLTLAKWLHGFNGTVEILAPNELTAREIRNEREIRSAMVSAKPIVGELVTDDEFEQLKGRTNIEVFKNLYTKDS